MKTNTIVDPGLYAYANPLQLGYLEAINEHGSILAAAKAAGRARSPFQAALKCVKAAAARQGYSPEHHMTHPVPDTHVAKGVSSYFNAQGVLTAQWVKSALDESKVEAMRQAAFAVMATEMPRLAPSAAVARANDDLCNLLTFTDYHMGMLAWRKEGGDDWDLKIAERVLWDSFCKMSEAMPRASTCVLNIQGDFLHSDGLLPVTPAHKHVLDQDGRFSKIVAVAIRVLRRLIDHALAHHAQVHLLIVEGNHDEASSVWLRQMFAALYEAEPRLTVNDSELPYYVYQHGDVMLAFHHGHKVKNEQLPLLFAAQFPRVWGDTLKRYCHTGHRHHLDEKEYSGMTITQHPTLSARDAYAARGGWIAERAALGITYHKTQGQFSRAYVSPDLTEVV